MSEIQIAWLELLMVGGLGGILILVGIGSNINTKKKNASCTAVTNGIVVKHSFNGEGRMAPIVEFSADDQTYRTKKKYNGIKSMSITGLPNAIKGSAWEDEKGWLHVKTGTFANMRQMAENLWPIGSEMTVYYNPGNPKKNYVDRPITNQFVLIIFVIMGAVCVALGILVFLLIQI
jgi:hypothetical protein